MDVDKSTKGDGCCTIDDHDRPVDMCDYNARDGHKCTRFEDAAVD